MQHLQTMSEDKSYKSADRQKFKGWLRKWQQARIPLLACLFVEILSPAKVLSLAFQDNNIDTVSSIQRLETAKKQLARLERKNLEDLDKVEKRDGKFFYQNVALCPTSMMLRSPQKCQSACYWERSRKPCTQGWRQRKTSMF